MEPNAEGTQGVLINCKCGRVPTKFVPVFAGDSSTNQSANFDIQQLQIRFN